MASNAENIDAEPRVDQIIHHEGANFTTIKEGLAFILVPQGTPTSTDPKAPQEDADKQSVFYNPIQQFNRDLSVLAIRAFGEDFIATQKLKREAENKNPARKLRLERKKQNKRAQKNVLKAGKDEEDDAQNPSKRRKIDGDEQHAEVAAEDGFIAFEAEGLEADVPADLSHAPTHVSETILLSTTNDVAQEASTSDQQPTAETAEPTPGPDGEAAQINPSFRILDALSATGLRALRYAQEIPFATAITANDMSHKATASIALNVEHNKLTDKITPNTGNAIAHMYSFVGKRGYDVIDLDPYGTAAPFLDSALQALTNGGLLCVTCTDSGVFASIGYLEKTYSQYGGLPIKGFHSHEGGLRLILHAIATSASRYGLAIEPLLSLSIDYYARVFVRVRKSPADVKFLAGKTMIVYNCDAGCGAWQTQFLARNTRREKKDGSVNYKHSFAQAPSASPFCEHCRTKTHLSGPMYGGPLHNPAFIERILSYLPNLDADTYGTIPRIEGMLQTAYEETLEPLYSNKKKTKDAKNKTDNTEKAKAKDVALIPQTDPAQIDHHPFFFTPSNLAKIIHCQAPPDASIRGALRRAGFRATRSHCKPGTIRTDASWKDLWYIMREWERQKSPIKPNSLAKTSAGWQIMNKVYGLKEEASERDAVVEELEGVEEVAKGAGGQTYKVIFDEEMGRNTGPKLVRYQLNPRANWGPMNRAK